MISPPRFFYKMRYNIGLEKLEEGYGNDDIDGSGEENEGDVPQ